MATIAVRNGKVGVGSVILTANQQLTLNDTGTPHVSSARSGQFTFASGVLTLNDVPLNDAIVELNRWYNTDIRIASPGMNNRMRGVSGVFGSESIPELANMLEFMFNVRVEQRGRLLTIHSR
jgi:ferric-dicitrate binding protein FerR (iron transport regulator)